MRRSHWGYATSNWAEGLHHPALLQDSSCYPSRRIQLLIPEFQSNDMEKTRKIGVSASKAVRKLTWAAKRTLSSKGETSPSATAAYIYKPLRSDKMIRVIDLLPSSSGDEELKCKMSQISVQSGGYTALSYEWGPRDMIHRVTVLDGHGKTRGYISVTTNLKNALYDLRDSPDVKQKRFWVDQITINQGDTTEKGHQVKSMTTIYKMAARVIVYLGPHDSDMESEQGALDLLDQLHNHYKPNYEHLSSQEAINKALHDIEILPVQELPGYISTGDPHWPALLHIVFGGWIRRLWMVQESMLCADTVMLRGKRRIDWLAAAAIPFLVHLGVIPYSIIVPVWPSLNLKMHLVDVVTVLLPGWVVRIAHKFAKNSNSIFTNSRDKHVNFQSLEENLYYYRVLECKDPRDQIFAVLGISSNQTQKLQIQPDYTQPVEELFVDVSRRIYITESALYPLTVISGHDISNATIPSWSLQSSDKTVSEVETRSFPHVHPIKACRLDFIHNGNYMRLYGHVVDVIQFKSDPSVFPNCFWEHDAYVDVFKLIFTTIFELFNILGHEDIHIDQFMRCWLCDPVRTAKQPLSRTIESFKCFIRYLANNLNTDTSALIQKEEPFATRIPMLFSLVLELLIESNNGQLLGNIGDEDSAATSRPVPDPWGEPTHGQETIGKNIWSRGILNSRSFAVTKEKRMCNVTGQAKPGDVIALFAGGELPYILRPAGDNKYRYVGTAYVPSLEDCAFYTREGRDPEDVAKEIDYEILLV